MPDLEDDYKFPDEIEATEEDKDTEVAETNSEKVEIEIEDDTPEEDRGREPMPKSLVEELEQDDLEVYDAKTKEKLKQMRKVWHDERRAKEQAYREQQEAITFAQKIMQENQRMKEMYAVGAKEYVQTVQNAASLELEVAKKAYKEAYDTGNSDQMVEAQQAMQHANLRLLQAKNFKPIPLQEEDYSVQQQYAPQQPQPVRYDKRLETWQERNPWFGQDEEMTASALGLHEKLKRNGVVVGSDEYYNTLDKTIRRRFAEYFGESENQKTEQVRTKPKTVVAPATRSTASNKVKLKASQVQLAKKLGLTPEQYAQAALKLEAQNG